MPCVKLSKNMRPSMNSFDLVQAIIINRMFECVDRFYIKKKNHGNAKQIARVHYANSNFLKIFLCFFFWYRFFRVHQYICIK